MGSVMARALRFWMNTVSYPWERPKVHGSAMAPAGFRLNTTAIHPE